MGFFDRLSKKVERVNRGEEPVESVAEVFVIDRAEMADNYWREMSQNILVNAVKGASQPIERAFVLVNFKSGEEAFEIFYQVDGQLITWRALGEEGREKIAGRLLPQAKEVAEAVHQEFDEGGLERMVYAMLQFEQATMAWFGRRRTAETPEAQLTFDQLSKAWFDRLSTQAPQQALDRDSPLPYVEL